MLALGQLNIWKQCYSRPAKLSLWTFACAPCFHTFRTDHTSMILTTDSVLPFLASSMKGKYLVWISSVNGSVMYWNNTSVEVKGLRWSLRPTMMKKTVSKLALSVRRFSQTINNSFLKKKPSSCIYKNSDYFLADCWREHLKFVKGHFLFSFFPNPRVVLSQSHLMEDKLPYHTLRRQCNEKSKAFFHSFVYHVRI